MNEPCLDTRAEAEFLAGHAEHAANIPLEELSECVHELPHKGSVVRLAGDTSARTAEAQRFLALHWRVETGHGEPTITGPARVRLWRPNAFLEEVVAAMPSRGRSLDLACGTGRDAVFLAQSGFDTVAVDVLPDAIARAARLALRNAVALDARALDLEREPLPAGRFALITGFAYLQRNLFDAMRAATEPGGSIVYETFLTAHRDKYGKPRRPEFLLESGELRSRFADWEIARYEEGEFTPGRITARLAAIKPLGKG